MTDGQLDLNKLSLLPDVVKRKILGVLDSSTATADPPSADDSCRPLHLLQQRADKSTPDTPGFACVIKSLEVRQRDLKLPLLQPGGACIVDNLLSPIEADVSTYMSTVIRTAASLHFRCR